MVSGSLKKFSLILLVLFALLALIFAVGIYKFGRRGGPTLTVSKIIPYPAALVDWEVVRYNNFLKNLRALENYWSFQAAASGSLAIPDKPDILSSLLERMIENKIVQIQARKSGIAVSAAEIEKEWQNLDGGPDLQAIYGLSEEEFKKRILRDYLLPQKVAAFLRQEQVGEQNNLQARLSALEAKIRLGQDFSALARQYSDDEATRGAGGETGYFSIGAFPPPLEKAILDLKIGQVSKPIVHDSGYYVFKLEDLLYDDQGRPTQMNVRQILLRGFDFAGWLEQQKKQLTIYRFF